MKLRHIVGLAGVDILFQPGDISDCFSGDEAQRLIDNGFAVPATEGAVKSAPVIERATRKGPKEKR
jgi:hypothetical protein